LTPGLEASEEEARRKDETDCSRRAYRFSGDSREAKEKTEGFEGVGVSNISDHERIAL
jgi:hypothetical protein